jgi:hypothetical protein
MALPYIASLPFFNLAKTISSKRGWDLFPNGAADPPPRGTLADRPTSAPQLVLTAGASDEDG